MKPRAGRIAAVTAAGLAYAALALPALRDLGPGAGSLGMIPVTTAALALGLRGGLIVFTLVVVVDVPLYALAGLDFLALKTLLYALFFGLLASALGLLSDLKRQRVERRAGEQEQQARLRALLDQLPVLLWSTDPALRLTFNKGLERRLGEEVPRLDLHRRALQGETSSFELSLNGRDYEAHLEPLRGEAGQVLGSIGTALDVTARRRAETEVGHARARFAALVEQVPAVTYVYSFEQDRLAYVSPQVRELFGFDAEDWQAHPQLWHNQVHPEDREHAFAARERCRRAGAPLNAEYRMLSRSGEAVWVHDRARVMRDGSGRPRQIQGLIFDISERKRIEAERQRAEEALRESEAKSRFLATMSHELRTPLNSVLGFAQLLASGEFGSLTERQGRYVENIRASGRHLLDLVNDVLDVAEAKGGQMRVRLEPVDLRETITQVLSRVRVQAESKSIRLELERSRQLQARADAERLAQVMFNLLDNAIKFTPPSGRVTVSLNEEGAQVAITVADTGIGVPSQDQARIFDHFVQVESGRTRKEAGTGLGLALSRELVHLMGGSIGLSSQPGRGSAFTVTLPLAAYDAAVPPPHGRRSRRSASRLSASTRAAEAR